MHMEICAGSEQGIKPCEGKHKNPLANGIPFPWNGVPSPTALVPIPPPHREAELRERGRAARKEPEKREKTENPT